MPIGAYDPWIYNHCTPEQAVTMADAAGARLIVPVHHQSFRLSNEPFMEPIERIQQALAQEHDRLALREIGETVVIRSCVIARSLAGAAPRTRHCRDSVATSLKGASCTRPTPIAKLEHRPAMRDLPGVQDDAGQSVAKWAGLGG